MEEQDTIPGKDSSCHYNSRLILEPKSASHRLGTEDSFPVGEVTRTRSWPFTSIYSANPQSSLCTLSLFKHLITS